MPRARSAATSCSRPRPSYHAPGTCTFYGTANSNQMLMEIMGLHLPGASFVNPGTAAARALTREAAKRRCCAHRRTADYTPIGHIIDETAIVNGMVGLLPPAARPTTPCIWSPWRARRASSLTWEDISTSSLRVVPLLARVYPNGIADVNHFHAAGGMGFLIRELLDGGIAARRRDGLGRFGLG
jgi:phosphogluconate dehydratase